MEVKLKDIKPSLGEDATEEEIEHLFKQLLYVASLDYSPIEPIERFGYAIFKDDMVNPVTGQKIEENMNVNVEIVLDASGSMAKTINGTPMMDIAKSSI